MTALYTFYSILALLHEDTCPITQNKGVPICYNYKARYFDYIIVGAGTAGCILANRLSEDPKINVLLIEAGDYPSRDSEIPLRFRTLQRTKEDWAFKVNDPKLFRGYVNNQGSMPQGKALGGGSTINGMIHTEGVPHDYDMWSQMVDDSWSWSNLRPYFDKLHEYSRFTNYTSRRIGRSAIEQAAKELNISVNNPRTEFGYRDTSLNIHQNARYSKVKAYLRPIANRTNLCVVINRSVNKILMLNDTTAQGIEVQELNGVVALTARKEVIVAAGPVNSPKILMLSGIGPKKHLTELGVPRMYQDLPVGQNLQDHILLPVAVTFLGDRRSVDATYQKMAYCATGAYLGTIDMNNFIGFFSTRNVTTHPDVELVHNQIPWQDYGQLWVFARNIGLKPRYARQLYRANALSSLFLIMPILLHPKSLGEILLKSLDRNDPPLILPNFFQDEDDIQVLVDTIKNFIRPILKSSPFKYSQMLEFDIPECAEYPKGSDGYLRCYVMTLGTTSFHPAGTCRMGKNREGSVVDTQLKVWGVDNLRVIDSSIMPYVISGHPDTPTAMVAEKGADLIKGEPGTSV